MNQISKLSCPSCYPVKTAPLPNLTSDRAVAARSAQRLEAPRRLDSVARRRGRGCRRGGRGGAAAGDARRRVAAHGPLHRPAHPGRHRRARRRATPRRRPVGVRRARGVAASTGRLRDDRVARRVEVDDPPGTARRPLPTPPSRPVVAVWTSKPARRKRSRRLSSVGTSSSTTNNRCLFIGLTHPPKKP